MFLSPHIDIIGYIVAKSYLTPKNFIFLSFFKHILLTKLVLVFLFCFWFGGILGSASGAELPVSLSNHVGFMPRI